MRFGVALALALAWGSGQAATATVALLIDDLGYSRERARRALALPPPVAVAVLPHTPHARPIARAATGAGIDVLLHLPMAAEGVPVGRGVLHAGMSPAMLRAGLRDALAAVPGAVGVNNHEGSALTIERRPMAVLMHALARTGGDLVFVDSRTTARSHAEAAAVAAGLRATRRDLFLDNRRDARAIERQVERWVAHARAHGCALAIGHPYPETLAVLERMLPRLDGVRRVDIRTYARVCGTQRGGRQWHAFSYRSPMAARSSRPSASSISSGAPDSMSSAPD